MLRSTLMSGIVWFVISRSLLHNITDDTILLYTLVFALHFFSSALGSLHPIGTPPLGSLLRSLLHNITDDTILLYTLVFALHFFFRPRIPSSHRDPTSWYPPTLVDFANHYTIRQVSKTGTSVSVSVQTKQ